MLCIDLCDLKHVSRGSALDGYFNVGWRFHVVWRSSVVIWPASLVVSYFTTPGELWSTIINTMYFVAKVPWWHKIWNLMHGIHRILTNYLGLCDTWMANYWGTEWNSVIRSAKFLSHGACWIALQVPIHSRSRGANNRLGTVHCRTCKWYYHWTKSQKVCNKLVLITFVCIVCTELQFYISVAVLSTLALSGRLSSCFAKEKNVLAHDTFWWNIQGAVWNTVSVWPLHDVLNFVICN